MTNLDFENWLRDFEKAAYAVVQAEVAEMRTRRRLAGPMSTEEVDELMHAHELAVAELAECRHKLQQIKDSLQE